MEPSLHITRLCSLGQIQEAISLFHSLHPKPTSPVTCAALLHACARHRLLYHGQSIHNHLLSSSSSWPTSLTNHLINLYSKCGQLGTARRLFDETPDPNLVSWTALLSGYAQHGAHGDCFRLFSSMIGHCLPNDFALASVLSSCAGARDGCGGRQAHGVACKTAFDGNVFVGNALITMYSSCCDGGGDYGWGVFRTMRFRNTITWNAMIAGYLMNGRAESAVALFKAMLWEGVELDRPTMVSTIPACSGLVLCKQLHSLTIKSGFALEIEVATVLIKALSGFGAEVDDCYKVFSEATHRDAMSWTGIIGSCAEQDPEKAILLFRRMLAEDGVPLDKHMLSVVLKACSLLATERHGSVVHSLVLRSGFENDVVIGNTLIHMYGRCGCIAPAECVFEEMADRDVVSWNSMIKAHAMHGQAEDALRVFSLMSCSPDAVTFVGVLSACSHGGLVDEGRKLFRMMSEDYGITPQVDHYACMVDVLGRAGCLAEAEKLINQMQMDPDPIVWSALLGACRKHKEVVIGERAAQKLMELQPRNSIGYVMMSNIYCASGSYNGAAFVRKGMKECGVKKETGLSWIEVHNRVYEFAVGGQRHPQIDSIYRYLQRIVDELKDLGYVAETSLVLHEIEEKHKEEQLLHHSEKLALAFGLMNSSPAQVSVRIMKNIRTCSDCHSFMKFASNLTGKEIVLRDTNRFHHFKNGECSCGDYW